MKPVLLVLIALLSGCMTTAYIGKHDIQLSKSEIGDLVSIEKTLHFKDSSIDIIWIPGEREFGFELFNRSDSNLSILWEKSTILLGGKVYSIEHTGSQAIGAEKPGQVTLIAGKTVLNDALRPGGMMVTNSSGNDSASAWTETNFYAIPSGKDSFEVAKETFDSKGKLITIRLQMKKGKVLLNYSFTFKFFEPAVVKTYEMPKGFFVKIGLGLSLVIVATLIAANPFDFTWP